MLLFLSSILKHSLPSWINLLYLTMACMARSADLNIFPMFKIYQYHKEMMVRMYIFPFIKNIILWTAKFYYKHEGAPKPVGRDAQNLGNP